MNRVARHSRLTCPGFRVDQAFHRLLKSPVQAVLCQGTTLVVPFSCVQEHGFSAAHGMQGLKPAVKRGPSARLKSCPDTKLTPFEFSSAGLSRAAWIG